MANSSIYVRVAQLQQGQPIVDGSGKPAPWFMRALNDAFGNLTQAINEVRQLPDIQAQLQAAIDNANDAAMTAQAAADTAQQAADATKREAALTNSYIDPDSVLTATASTISIAAHTRMYADGTSASVNAGTVAATASGDVDYVSYVDPTRAGGAVTYIASTTAPVQSGDTHVVGAVTIPAMGSPSQPGGRGPRPPGYVQPDLQ